MKPWELAAKQLGSPEPAKLKPWEMAAQALGNPQTAQERQNVRRGLNPDGSRLLPGAGQQKWHSREVADSLPDTTTDVPMTAEMKREMDALAAEEREAAKQGEAPRGIGTYIEDRLTASGKTSLNAMSGLVKLANTDYGTGLGPADTTVGIAANLLGRLGSDTAKEYSNKLNAQAKPRSEYGEAVAGVIDEYAQSAGDYASPQEKWNDRKLAEAKGLLGKLDYVSKNPSVIPEQFLNSIGYMAAGGGAGGAVARLGTTASVGANLGTQALLSASSSADGAREIINQLPDEELAQFPEFQALLSDYDAPTARKILSQRATDQAFATGIIANAALFGLTAKLPSLERIMHGASGASASRSVNAIRTLLGEAAQEGGQGGLEQVAANVGTSAADSRVGLLDNVPEAAFMEAITTAPAAVTAGYMQTPAAKQQKLAEELKAQRAVAATPEEGGVLDAGIALAEARAGQTEKKGYYERMREAAKAKNGTESVGTAPGVPELGERTAQAQAVEANQGAQGVEQAQDQDTIDETELRRLLAEQFPEERSPEDTINPPVVEQGVSQPAILASRNVESAYDKGLADRRALAQRHRAESNSLADYAEREQREWLGGVAPPKDGRLKLYRAVRNGEDVQPGDYVTNSRTYAANHLENNMGGDGKVIEFDGNITDIFPADGPREFWYLPDQTVNETPESDGIESEELDPNDPLIARMLAEQEAGMARRETERKEGPSDALTEGFRELAKNPELFRSGMLKAGKTISELAPKNDLIYGGVSTEGSENGVPYHKMIVDQGAAGQRTAKIYTVGNDVWIDVAGLEGGAGGGDQVYNTAQSLAINTGRNFIEDPAGLSDTAMYRRPMQQTSGILKADSAENFPAGEFLQSQRVDGPKTRPIKQDPQRRVNPSLREHLLTDHANATLAVPEVKGIRYDADSEQFVDRAGAVVTDDDFDRLAEYRRANPVGSAMVRVRADVGGAKKAAPVGRNTLKVAALVETLMGVTDPGTRSKLVGQLRSIAARGPGAGALGPLKGILPSRSVEDEVTSLQKELASIESEYNTLRARKFTDEEWEGVGVRSKPVRQRLFDLTGDWYGRPSKKLKRPSDDRLTAEYASPDEVPNEVRDWVRKHSAILTSDATDAVRWGRIVDTLSDERYPTGAMTIYRATADGDEIRPGDWVTTDRAYAEEHLSRYLNGKGAVLSENVDGRDVLVSPTGNSEEAIYAPRKLSGPYENKGVLASQDKPERKHASISVASIRDTITRTYGRRATKLLDSGRTKIIQSMADLPSEVRSRVEPVQSVGSGTIQGFYDQKTGNSYLVADSFKRIEDVAPVLLHEEGVHAGMKAILGERFKEFADRLRWLGKNGSESDRALIAKAISRVERAGTPEAFVDEELIAYVVQMAEQNTKPSEGFRKWLNRVLDAMRAWAAKNGLRDVSVEDLRLIARGALGHQARIEQKGVVAPSRVFHGSPHRFDKFTTEKMGTGEGAQAFGWGLYYTDTKAIADEYRKNLSASSTEPPRRFFRGEPLKAGTPEYHASTLVLNGGRTLASVKKEVAGWIKEAKPGEDVAHYRGVMAALERADKKGDFTQKPYEGQLYEVEIPDDDTMLLWDRPLSEQPEKVREALKRLPQRSGKNGDPIGKYIYDQMIELAAADSPNLKFKGAQQAASERLLALGIRGIKYLDGTSRASGAGSFNYVVFSGDDAQIQQTFYSRAANADEATGLPLNKDGTVTLYHHTSAAAAEKIRQTGMLKAAGEPDVYVTTRKETDTGYGDTAVAIRVKPDQLAIDDEFPDGRKDFRLSVGKPGGSIRVAVEQVKPSRTPDTITIDGKERSRVNSDGKVIAETDEALANFWRWFGSSAITDSEGRPKVVYHGTKAGEFERFDSGKSGSASKFAMFGKGFYFHTNEKSARLYGNNVMPVYIKAENPLNVTMGWANQSGDQAKADKAFADGHDAIVMDEAATEQIFVREPTQIKSAAKNKGTFSPSDPSILASRVAPDERIDEARRTASDKRQEAASSLGVTGPSVTWELNEGRFKDGMKAAFNRLRESLQDKYLSVLGAQGDIEKVTGQLITESQNVYRRENLMHGRVSDQIEALHDNKVTPIKTLMKKAKVTVDQIEDYLEARAAEDRNKRIAQINPNMPDGGAGISTADAADFLAGKAEGFRSKEKLTPELRTKVEAIVKRIDAIRDETRDRLLKSGQITKEQYASLSPTYAPLRGKEGDEVGGLPNRVGGGVDVRGTPIKRAMGRGEGNRAVNIIAEIIGDAERSIVQAEKTRVGQTLLRLVLANPNKDVWEVEPVKIERKYSEAQDLVYEAMKAIDNDPGAVRVMVDGKSYRLVLKDERMAKAVKNLGAEQLNAVFRFLGAINRYFSAVLTRYNPAFVPINMIRDMGMGIVGITAEHGARAGKDAVVNYLPAMRALWREARGKTPSGQTGTYAKEFSEAGGRTGFQKYENVEEIAQNLRDDFKGFYQMIREGKPVAYVARKLKESRLIQVVEDTNDTIENTMRLAAFIARRKKGDSIEASAEYAKNITVNFNRRGHATGIANSLFLFFNAATQGSTRTFQLLKNPKVQMTMGAMASLQFVLASLAMGADDEDEDGLTAWEKISDQEKLRNLIFPIVGEKDGRMTIKLVKVPMPYGFNFFTYTGGRLAQAMNSKDETHSAKFANDLGVAAVDAVSPLKFTDGMQGLKPYLWKVFDSIGYNQNDFGSQITSEQPYSRYEIPRASLGRSSTPEPYHVAAKALNKIGGGDEVTPPKIMGNLLDRSPEDLRFLTEAFGGGLLRTGTQAYSAGEKAYAGVDLNFSDLPIIKSLFTEVNIERSTQNRYYELRDRISREQARLRIVYDRDGKEAAQKLIDETPELKGFQLHKFKTGKFENKDGAIQLEARSGSLASEYKAAEKVLADIADRINAVRSDRGVSLGARMQKLEALEKEREAAQRKLNVKWSKSNG